MENNITVPLTPQRPPKSPGFAGFLGIFPFGVGALYNGQLTKALFHLIMFSGLVYSQRYGNAQPFMGLFLAAFIIYQFFDNIQSAKAINLAAAGRKTDAEAAQELPEAVSSGSVFWGTFLIALGIVLILANFDIIPYDTLRSLWPVAVIAVGVKLVADSLARKKNGNGN